MRQAVLWCVAALVALAVAAASSSTGSSAAVQADGTIVTVAGTGSDGATGDGGSATAAAINHPRGITVLADRSFVFAQPFIPMVRRVLPDGTISTAVGTGERGYGGDGGPATRALLDLVHGVAALPDGSFVVDDMGNNRIRRVWPDNTITTVVGTGENGFAGDGGPASAAAIALPRGVAARPNGELLIADTGNKRVRRVSPAGVISTVAGTGEAGFSGDAGPATAARLNRPFAVAPLPGDAFLIADLDNNRIRRVAADGRITTVAGTGDARFSGDGGPAHAASLNLPHAVAALPDGGFLIADTYNHRVRRVDSNGTITTVAGTGTAGYSGDGGPAIRAELNLPKALAVLPDGSGFLVGDAGNNRVRLVRFTRDVPPRIVAYSLRRLPLGGTTSYVFRLRVCDDSRASLKAEVRTSEQRGGTQTTSSFTRRLPSTGGGCRPYRFSWRLSGRLIPPYRVTARLRVRDAGGAWSNEVVDRA